MTTAYVCNLLRIASSIEASDPILAYELERNALAVINPGAKRFEEHVKETVDVLKALKEELEAADKKLDLDDAKEFAKFFDNEAEAQVEELRQILKVGAVLLRYADDTAGVMDKVKGFFKKKKKEPETEEKPAGYQMSEREQDEFVEGNRDWTDGSQKVEKESKENKEFFEDAKSVQTLFEKVR
jgi:SPX domain protein involved in polyphosphate accumulation